MYFMSFDLPREHPLRAIDREDALCGWFLYEYVTQRPEEGCILLKTHHFRLKSMLYNMFFGQRLYLCGRYLKG